MGGKPVVTALLLLLAATGCRACQNYADNAPTLANGPQVAPGHRAGSAFAPQAQQETPTTPTEMAQGPMLKLSSFDEQDKTQEAEPEIDAALLELIELEQK